MPYFTAPDNNFYRETYFAKRIENTESISYTYAQE